MKQLLIVVLENIDVLRCEWVNENITFSIENYLLLFRILLLCLIIIIWPILSFHWHGKHYLIIWNIPIVVLLTLSHLTSGVPITRCGAQNIECRVKMTAFNGLLYADLI